MPEILPSTLAWLITAVLTLYGLTAGAELGAGLWHGLARGRRGVITRLLIDEALSPIWEANHVWLIFSTVLLFVGFPDAYLWIFEHLHGPLSMGLLALSIRGAAYVFRRYGRGGALEGRLFGFLFSASSVVALFAFGWSIALATTGVLDTHQPYQLWDLATVAGIFSILHHAQLAASYLSFETSFPTLRNAFVERVVALETAWWLAFGVLLLCLGAKGSPIIDWVMHSTGGHIWFLTFIALSIGIAVTGARHPSLVRLGLIVRTGLISFGWALSQGRLLIAQLGAAPIDHLTEGSLSDLITTLLIGLSLVLPAYFYLLWVFKRPKPSTRQLIDAFQKFEPPRPNDSFPGEHFHRELTKRY